MTTNTSQECLKCGAHNRSIKVGITQTKLPKQKWFCYKCRKQYTTEKNPKSFQTVNSSRITPEMEDGEE